MASSLRRSMLVALNINSQGSNSGLQSVYTVTRKIKQIVLVTVIY
jgi:hypothetical protein